MKKIIKKKSTWLIVLGCLSIFFVAYFIVPEFYNLKYQVRSNNEPATAVDATVPETISTVPMEQPTIDEKEASVVVTHLATPTPLKAVYMSSWAAGTPSFRDKILGVVDRTELNAVVIDVKDFSGRISFQVSDPYLQKIGSSEIRIRDIKSLIDQLHKKNIYVIGRIASFQDQYMVKKFPDLAVKQLTDKAVIWKDHKGISWIDADSKDMWDYLIAIGKEAYGVGFDEVNYDYIRFPTDGDLHNIYFPISNGKIKKEVMRDFFKYLHENLSGTGVKISGDIFGMVVTNTDDLNIGQQLEYDAPYFDYLCPMVYPSHFPPGWDNFKNPATKPYEVVKGAMDKAVARLKVINEDPHKIRPWLQDFNMGAIYTKDMVDAQIKATYDAGLTSWMLWDPANTYTESALLPK